MNFEELKAQFKQQMSASIDAADDDSKVAFGAGMLLILTAMMRFDGPTLSTQVRIMHSALREIGDERGWGVDRNRI